MPNYETEKFIESHSKFLEKKFPDEDFNFGWGMSDDQIETKVYGLNPKVVVSTIKKGKITHCVENYN